ncbi:protein SYM1-like [Impatiens glandulifera]|uniref:protein SYM1-like n=1 Tax=Impatiens glandulifera TaxID=253017 RepID=UPI001FB1033B|nr:protein SYM1-like [Impatiens glandulifera]
MNSGILRNGRIISLSIHRTCLLLHQRHSITESIGASVVRNDKHYLRSYFRSSLLRKSRTKEVQLPVPAPAPANPISSSSNLGVVGWYLAMVKARPILTKSITSALVYTAADLSSQTISKPTSESYDLVRTSRMTAYAMVILGPSLHFWFTFISKTFPKRDLITTLKKMLLGQTIYGPTMTVIFFSSNAAIRGETIPEIVARLKRDLIPTMKSGIMYWPICDFVTFRFVPVHLQPLMSNSFSYLWTTYITYMASLDKASTH